MTTRRAAKKVAVAPRRTVASVQAELDALKAKVVEVALRIKDREGYCNEVDEFLEEAGLEIPTSKAIVTVEITDTRQFLDYHDEGDTMTTAVQRLMGLHYGDVDGRIVSIVEVK